MREAVVATVNKHPCDRRSRRLRRESTRFGEAAALRWRHYDNVVEPLGKFVIAVSYSTTKRLEKSVKTQQPREVPVHKTLAKVIAQWRLTGWTRMMKRRPSPDDLLIPSRRGRNRSRHHSLTKLHEDLERLGFRRRRQHDLRRTFISLARADGARKDVLEQVTHAPRGDIVDQYTTLPWALLCEEVAKLKVQLIEGKVVELPRAEAVNASRSGASSPRSLTVPLTVDAKTPKCLGIIKEVMVEAPGVES